MKKRTIGTLGFGIFLTGAALQTHALRLSAQENNLVKADAKTWLADLNLNLVTQGWGKAGKNVSVGEKPLSIGGVKFENGLGTHAESEVNLRLNGARHFRAQVGVDDETDGTASIVFRVRGDGRELWTSGLMKHGDAPKTVDLNLTGVKYLSLLVGDGGDGTGNDHADWGVAQFDSVEKSPEIVARTPEMEGKILPGRVWQDTQGNLIQAHGGGILKRGKTYYWYGEDKSTGYNNKVGVDGYASEDLVNWRPLGTVFKASDMPEKFREGGVAERPKVIYNEKTQKYVMWIHMDTNGYGTSEAGIGTSDKPEGPFVWLRSFRPIADSTYRDMNLFVDPDDGKAYTFYSGEGNATTHVVRLNDDFTDVERPMVEGKTWARVFPKTWREAAAPFKYGGKYYMITSGTSGWNPNAAKYGMADNILGPWKDMGNPVVGEGANTTYGSQSTFVLPVEGKPGQFIYMGDRWTPQDLSNSRYIWLPFKIKDDGTFTLEWRDSWELKDLTK